MPVTDIKDMAALKELMTAHDKIVIDFGAAWCPPCKKLAPEIDKASEVKENKDIFFAKVDVDEATDVSEHFEAESLPMFVFIAKGATVEKLTYKGADLKQIKANIEAFRGMAVEKK